MLDLFMTALVVVFSLFCLIAGRYSPTRRFWGGRIALALAGITWVASLLADILLSTQ